MINRETEGIFYAVEAAYRIYGVQSKKILVEVGVRDNFAFARIGSYAGGRRYAGRGKAHSLSFIVIIIFFIDVIIVFPEASHLRYIITDREIIIRRILYPEVSVFLADITAVEHATLLTFRSFALHIMENSMGAYKIVYTKGRRHKHSAVIICPKNGDEFIRKLRLHIDKTVILPNNTESAFKKKKDKH